MFFVLQLRVATSEELHKVCASGGGVRPVSDCLHRIELHLVCEQVKRLRLGQPSNVLHVLLPEDLLSIRFLKEGNFWRVVVLAELLLGLYINRNGQIKIIKGYITNSMRFKQLSHPLQAQAC